MDRISNAMVEIQFDATSVAWRPGIDPAAATRDLVSGAIKDPEATPRLELTSSQVLRGLMGLTDALPPKWVAVVDDEIAAGALVKHEPDSAGWRWLVAPTK